MIDLHTHSTASDGQYSPAELVEKAYNSGVSVLALTDHDTVAGLKEAQDAADKFGITFVPGVEINIERPGCEFHLLGLGLKNISSSLQEVLLSLQDNRGNRNLKMIELMKEAGISVSLEEVQAAFPGQVLGRPHFAAWLAEHKYVKYPQQAFDKYFARGRPCYVDKVGANLDEAVQAIYDSDGIPVIAHPLSLYLSWSKIEPVLEDFHSRGVLGLEAYHPGARVAKCEHLERLARKLGFFVTAGSDFHGEFVRRDRKLGHTCGNIKIDDRFWFEELKNHVE